MDSAEFMEALEEIVKEKGIDKEVILRLSKHRSYLPAKKFWNFSEHKGSYGQRKRKY